MKPKQPAPSDIADKFMLRFPDGMREDIREAAEKNNRSMNAEIIARLQQSFGPIATDTGLLMPTQRWIDMEKMVVKLYDEVQKLRSENQMLGKVQTLDSHITQTDKDPAL